MRRKPTRREVEEWRELAEEYGCISEQGEIFFGRCLLEAKEGESITLKSITPIVASPWTRSDVKQIQPPILFDRTDRGEIILPGRWWADMLEDLSDSENVTSRHPDPPDVLLPPDTDTVELVVTSEDGQPILCEALPPGERINLKRRSRP